MVKEELVSVLECDDEGDGAERVESMVSQYH